MVKLTQKQIDDLKNQMQEIASLKRRYADFIDDSFLRDTSTAKFNCNVLDAQLDALNELINNGYVRLSIHYNYLKHLGY